ncbi:interleukin 21 receptor, tandem duplicate 1 [Danio aesculapii]|uniref:interleukin 21 receptor, tandem duplicate 1 n=1 Tax=Danio aesculapii TaxID=1142201 RepID=UPI0024BFE913|nr:interleukin 21 receptor, tandem duplicate 1 [Danio aesculapii]
MHLSRVDHSFFPSSSMMASWRATFLLVVCGLLQCNDAACSVTCTTDFISALNCSASDLTGTASCDVVASCRDEFFAVNGSCTIRSPQSWCTMEPKDLYLMMSYDTNCFITVTQMDKQGEMEIPIQRYSENIVLYKYTKLKQPFNLTLTKTDGGFNLTWDVAYTDNDLYEQLIYRVRVRSKSSPEKELIYILQQNQQSMVILSEKLQPGTQYVANVQVAVNPNWFNSMWSEWSDGVEWIAESPEQYYFLLLAIPIVIMMALLIVFSGKLGGIKKLTFQHIPSPQEYFTPLYHTYQGDFKKWVGPVLTFNNFDVLEKSTPLQVLCEKQQNQSSEEPANDQIGERDFGPEGQSASKLYFLGSSSQEHSGGHISMDTVTVSDQEGIMGDWSGNSRRRSLDGFSNANQRAPEIDQPLLRAASGSLQGSDFDWHLQEHDLENMEQVSLDSYSSNEQSDDGYPQMGLDLDTIDSGFLESECSSPSAFDGNEQIETSSLDGVEGSHSNYVKQWVAFTAVQVEAHSSGN